MSQLNHSRAHTRYQKDRYEKRRWRQAKERYKNWAFCWDDQHPEEIRERTLQGDKDPVGWPFNLEAGRFNRNPFNLCSCYMCSYPTNEPGRRARAKAAWQEVERLAWEDGAHAHSAASYYDGSRRD